jgi:flavin reductase (DIM6/NTAB) family NADH-FMN oxidoreductase RutF
MKKSLGPRISVYPTPVWVVGSYDAEGKPNVMTAAWGGVCCSKPPCVYVSLRQATYSYGNLMARKAYTVSVPSQDHVLEADFFGLASGRDVDKFAKTGLTPERSEHVDAPYVAEFPIVLECKVVHTIELGLHTQFVGEIVNVLADEDVLTGEKARPAMERIRPLVYSTDQRTYHGIGENLGQGFSMGLELMDPKE